MLLVRMANRLPSGCKSSAIYDVHADGLSVGPAARSSLFVVFKVDGWILGAETQEHRTHPSNASAKRLHRRPAHEDQGPHLTGGGPYPPPAAGWRGSSLKYSRHSRSSRHIGRLRRAALRSSIRVDGSPGFRPLVVSVVQRCLTSLGANRSRRLQPSCEFAWLIDEPVSLVQFLGRKTGKPKPVARHATACARGASRPPVDDGITNE